jgi:ribonuclease R
VPPRLEAHRLIEEMMIAANVAAAETLEKRKTPLVYRVHDSPSREKLDALRDFLASLDLPLAKTEAVRPADFNRILDKARDAGRSEQVSEMVLRSQAQAIYSAGNYGHFGLNLDRYAHFTSPIRRYADLIVHRALIAALDLGPDGLTASEIDKLTPIAEHISGTERRAMIAERVTVDRLLAQFLSTKIGASFTGKISGVTRSGLFVRLDDTGADGFIPASTIGQDYYRFVEQEQAMVGDRTGERFGLGDSVTVKLVEAAPVAGALRFELLSEGRMDKNAPSRRPRKYPYKARPPRGRKR